MSSPRSKFFSGGKLSNKSSGSSGLRILWIPGRHKSHPKGHFDSTNKQVVHNNAQKKSEVWSLGGSKHQRDLIDPDPDNSLFEGPSVSGLTSACALGAVGAEKCATATTTPTITVSAAADSESAGANSYTATHTLSTASTTPLVSVPNSPDTGATSKIIITKTTNATDSTNSSDVSMPAKTTFTTVTTTTTAEIMDDNRFSILDKEISDEIDVYDLPSPPKNGFNMPSPEDAASTLLNASAGTTASTATSPSPSPSDMPNQQNESDSVTGSPTKKKHHKNENNNHQNDINSIESISDNTKIPSTDLEWIDELLLEHNSKELLKKKKKKKKLSTTKELDQLDGVSKHNSNGDANDEDEKVVKCLYYTLMCCECTIS